MDTPGLPKGQSADGSRRAANITGSASSRRHNVAASESLPGWTWNPHDDDFERGMAILRRFTKRTGHARVTRDHVEQGFRLGRWVNQKRTAQYRGRLSAA